MSVILLPDKWRRQPRGPIAVRPQWVGRGLTALYVLNAQSWRINAVTGAIGGTASGAWHTYEPESITSSGNGTEHIDFAVGVTPATIVISYAMISGVVAWSNLRRDTIVWSGLYDQQTTTSEDFAGFIGPLPTRGIGIPTYAFRWAEQNNYRGVADGGTVQVDTSTGAVPGDRTFISLGIAKRGGIADNPSETRATLIAAFSQGLSDPEMQAITAAPWGELVRKQPRILYFTAPSGGTTITADSLTHGHSLGSPSLTQANVLSVQGVSQAHSLGAPALTQHQVLAVDAIAQAHSLGTVTLTQAHILTVQGLAQSHTLDAPILAQRHLLAPDALTQAHTLGNITLTIAGSIAAADIAQGHSIGTPALTQHNVLAVAALMQAHSLDQPALSQAGTLAVQNMTQAQVLDAVALVQHHALAVQALLQGHALGNITLTASDALAIDGLTHAQMLGAPSLTQHNVLAVQNMTQAQILQAVTLGGLVIGSLRGTLVAYSLLDGEVVCRALLSGSLETVH